MSALALGPDPLRPLEGHWLFERAISTGASCKGRAVWRQEGHFLRYREDGTMRLEDGRSFVAYRSYLFALEGADLLVYFDERPIRLFHRAPLMRMADGVLQAQGRHLCGADNYATSYEIGPTVRIVHEVKGPNKDYRMVATYRPQTMR